MTLPAPSPYPAAPDNAVMNGWRCDEIPAVTEPPAPGYTECVVTSWQTVNPAPSPAPEPSPEPSPTTTTEPVTNVAYEGGYTYEPSNYSDIGPWFATVIFALIFAPYCWETLVKWVREVLSNV